VAYTNTGGFIIVLTKKYNAETRFFIMKSYKYTNVYDCQDEGVWATQLLHDSTLKDAFTGTKNVILFFSVNGSRAFQGYVRNFSPAAAK
jgi:hypothetical protein